MDWLTLPLSAPMMLHACRKAVEWLHIKRIQSECQFHLNDLVEQRKVLELETNALRNEVLTDSLTELLNRRAFNQHLDYAVSQWERHHRPFVLILGDLDYFKLINDRFGHLVGDQVLKAVAQRISSSLRRSDLAFRIGGEEFAVLLSESSLHAGAEVAEKIRRRIDEQPVTLDSGQNVFPTMSFGVGTPDGADAENLFARVDQSLYVAKRKGRNRIEVLAGAD
jgi:diguanylate cyclase (GGDEF)-like protein